MSFNNFTILLVALITNVNSYAYSNNNLKAVFFCENYNEEQAIAWAENNHINYISFSETENALLIEEEKILYSNDVCFTSKIRVANKHLAFSRNELIVRVKPGKETDFLDYLERHSLSSATKHKFIPNQYLIKNVAQNEIELNRINKDLKQQDWYRVGQINTVHTLSVTSVNDPLFERQWALRNEGTLLQGSGTIDADMQVDSAWNKTTGNGIKIAVLDSGVDTVHEDLIQNLFPGYDAFADDDQNTFGYPTPNYSSDGHGTACAGIAAAAGNNSKGIAGVAYGANILPIRIFFYFDYGGQIGIQPSINSNAQIDGSAYAWRQADADIMSTSAGLPDQIINQLNIPTDVMNDEITEAYNNARDGKGIAMFFSSGNEDSTVIWPAKLPETIAVGASSMCDERKNPNDCSPESWGSCYGPNLDFVAPGVRISSTDMTGSNGYSNNDYTFTFNGTSAACPNAAGVGALVLSMNPNLHARDVRAIMSITAHKDTLYQFDSTYQHGAWNEEVGYGRVDAYKAVRLAETYQSSVGIFDKVTEQIADLKIYPNPSSGRVVIKSISDNINDVKVFNIEGKLLTEFRLQASTSKSLDLSKGMYFVTKVSNGKMGIAQKLIVY